MNTDDWMERVSIEESVSTLSIQEIEQKKELLREVVQEIAKASKSENTKKAYRSDWNRYTSWCNQMQCVHLPATDDTLSMYFADMMMVGYKTSTIIRALSTIQEAHRKAGHPFNATPILDSVVQGVKRLNGMKQKGKEPVKADLLIQLVGQIPIDDDILHVRDRFLLLFSWSSSLRRSELVNLNVEDIQEEEAGLVVHLQKSKTDQESIGRYIGIPFGQNPSTCPVFAYQKWIEMSNIREGSLFRGVNRHRQVRKNRMNAESINTILKKHIKAAGLKDEDFGAHSLRAGYVTTARAMNVPDHIIQEQTGHTSTVMLDRYTRNEVLSKNNSPKLGL